MEAPPIHNMAKHSVDDVSNNCHDPIGLDQGWPTKHWDHQHLTIFLLVAKSMQSTVMLFFWQGKW
jgi:hypothetical protein